MPLTTYEEVRPWARAIKEQVLTRRMPRWHAARGFGAFRNDPTPTPIELAMIVAWVDGGLPRGAERAAGATGPGVKGAGADGTGGARGAIRLVVPASADRGAAVRTGPRWVTGWSFAPGDPLITGAVISSDAGMVGNWVAGDPDVQLPRGSAMRVSGRLQVDVHRRRATDYEQAHTPRRSVLRLRTRATAPARRVWTEVASCSAARTGRAAQLIAVRPLLADHADARIWIERIGAPRTIVGWFRDFDADYPRTYWLARAADLSAEARVSSSERCDLVVTLTSAR